jgi:hypothetical protein
MVATNLTICQISRPRSPGQAGHQVGLVIPTKGEAVVTRRAKADHRNISKRDIFLKARMLSEGVRVEMIREPPPGWKLPELPEDLSERARQPIQVDVSDGDAVISAIRQQQEFSYQECLLGNIIILDSAEIPAPIISKPSSALTLTLNGESAQISEGGQVLAKGIFFSPSARQPWSKRRLSSGLCVDEVLFGTSPGIVNVLFNLSCYNHNSNQACRYCGLFGNSASETVAELPLATLREYAAMQAEAVKIMTDCGWRGVVSFGGGALPPSIRGEYLDRLETVVEPLHHQLDSKTLSELHFVYNHYPPEDFSDFHRMKQMGIHSTSIDMEVVTSKAFAAICPGKHAYKPLEHWKEAQEASLEASLISATNIVAGLEPKQALLEGVHERLSKGVFPVPLQFMPTPSAPMARTPSKSAEWIVDVAERVADAYIRGSINVTGPFGRAATMSVARKLAPKAIRRMIPKGWDVPSSAAMPMSVNCVAFDELVRRVHRIPGGRFIPLPTAGVNTLPGDVPAGP